MRFNLGTILVVAVFVLGAVAASYILGVASASPEGTSPGNILQQIREAQKPNLVPRALRLLEDEYFMEIDADVRQQMIYGAVQGMLSVLRDEPFLDDFTNFYDPELYDDLEAQTTGEYAGVGILMGVTSDGMYPEIVIVFPNTPAEENGLEEGDIITEVNGEETFGMILPEVATLIKGDPGTEVALRVYRAADGEFQDFNVERRNVQFSSVREPEVLADGVGFIEISSFAEDTDQQFHLAMEELMAQDIQALIIDLRNNTGGLLEAGVQVADYFIDEGPIVEVKVRSGEGRTYYATPEKQKYHLPIVVLVNGNTASTSEVLTGALRDYGLCKVVGEQTFGKGVVQAVTPMETEQVERISDSGQVISTMEYKSALAITIGKYYTPLGLDIHGVGIEPNIWYDYNARLVEDTALQEYEERIDAEREDLRRLRAEILEYLRVYDAEKDRSLEVASMLAQGLDVPDVAQVQPETNDHLPLAAESTPPEQPEELQDGGVAAPDETGTEE